MISKLAYLLADQVEHLVVGVVRHEVDTRTDIRAGNELQVQGVAADADTVGGSIVGTLKSAVGGAGLGIRAKSSVPLVAVIAVVVSAGRGVVEPAPVRVEDDLGVNGCAATGLGALLRGQRRVDLRSEGTDLLAENDGREAGSDESSTGEHG
jgi:hypothetical protein